MTLSYKSINNENKEIQQVNMYNSLGALVYKNSNNQQNYSIDVSPFSKGLYYVNIQLADAILSKKVVIN